LSPSLEAQIVDIADEIAYDNHDLDDGLNSRLLQEKELEIIDLWRETKNALEKRYPGIKNPLKRYQIIRSLIAILVTDAIEESKKRLTGNKIKSLSDVKHHPGKLIDFSNTLRKKREPLRAFLQIKLYQHYRVNRMSDKARRFIEKMFCVYVKNPAMLPTEYQQKITRHNSTYVVVCDYIASMTDRFALDEYEKLFNPYKKV